MCQHEGVGPSIEEMMPAQQSDIPGVTAETQVDHEVSDYETKVPQLSSQ